MANVLIVVMMAFTKELRYVKLAMKLVQHAKMVDKRVATVAKDKTHFQSKV